MWHNGGPLRSRSRYRRQAQVNKRCIEGLYERDSFVTRGWHIRRAAQVGRLVPLCRRRQRAGLVAKWTDAGAKIAFDAHPVGQHSSPAGP